MTNYALPWYYYADYGTAKPSEFLCRISEGSKQKGGIRMATSSISKNFVIKDDKTARRFEKIAKMKQTKGTEKSGAYREGKEALKRMFGK